MRYCLEEILTTSFTSSSKLNICTGLYLSIIMFFKIQVGLNYEGNYFYYQ